MIRSASHVRVRTLVLAAAALFGIGTACTEGRLPTQVGGLSPTSVRLSLNATVSSAGRAMKVTASYVQAARPSVLIPFFNTELTLTGTETQLPLRLDIANCIADPTRELPPGLSPAELAQTCIIYLSLALFDAAGQLIDQVALAPIQAKPGTDAVAPPVVLGSVVTSVTISPRTITLNAIGFTSKLTPVVLDNRGQPLPSAAVTYLSLLPSVATVDVSGLVTGRAIGTARVVATSRDKADTATVTVRQVIKSVTITGAPATLVQGDSILVTGVVRDSADVVIPASAAPVGFASSDATVLAVNAATGRVRAAGLGTAAVRATAGGVTTAVNITVQQIPIARVVVTPGTASVRVGQTTQFVGAPQDAAGNAIVGRTVTWASSDTSVATVSATGLATAKKTGSATITATSQTVSGSATLNVSLVPVSRVVVSPSVAQVNRGFTLQLTAVAQDSAGNPLTGRVIVWTSSDSTAASVSQTGLVTGKVDGQLTITATTEGKSGSSTVTVSGNVLSINPQPAGTLSGALLSPQPTITVIDVTGATNNSVNVPVVASIASGNGVLSGTTTMNAVNGVATFTDLRIIGSGRFQLGFSTGFTPPATSAAFNIAALPPTQLGVATQPAGAVTGAPFATQPIVEVRDVNNVLVVTATAPVTATLAPSSTGSGILSGTTTVNAVNGRAVFTDLKISATGSYALVFTSASLTQGTSVTFPVTLSPPTQLAVSTQPGGVATGSALSPQPIVQVRDANGNVVAGATNIVTATLAAGSFGTLAGTTSMAAVNGVAAFTDLTITGAGTSALLFTSSGLTQSTSASVTTTALPPTQLFVGTQPGGAQTGAALAPQPVVLVKDVNNGVVAGSTVAVTATLNGAGGTLSGTTTVNAVNGVASFTNLVVTGIGSYTLTFSSGALTPTTSGSFGITALPPTQLGISTQPSGGQTGGPLTTQPVVQVRDASNATVAGATNAVTATLNGAGGTLTGTTTVNAVDGVATFTNLVVTGSGTYTLSFSAGALTPATSGSITISALPPTQLGIGTQPGGAQTGAALAPQPVVQVKDVNNGVVAGSTVAVTATLNGAGGTLSGTTTVNAVNGVASFTNLVVTGIGSYTLTFSSGALTPTTSGSFGITALPPTQLGISTQPSGGQTGGPLTTQPVVQVRDASNATVAGATNAVTATLNGAGGTLTGTTTVNAVDGVATFTNLVVTGSGTYTLSFSAGALTPATSGSITISALPPTQLGIGTQPGGAQTGAVLAPQPVVQVRDASGGVVNGSTAAVTATLNGGGGTLSGTTTVNAVNGLATFTNLVVTGTGSYTLTFASGALTPATSGSFGITAQPPTQLGISTQPGGAQTGSPLSPQPLVEIRNASGGVVAGATNLVTASLNGAGGTLSGTTSVSAVNGVATFTNLVVTGPGTYTITFISGTLPNATSGSITITDLPPTQLNFAAQPGGAQTGTPLSPQPVIDVRNANFTVVQGSTVPVTATLNGAGGTLSGTTTVNAVNGVATFTNLLVTGPGSYTLTFTSGSLTPVTSNTFGITAAPASQLGISTPPSGAQTGSPLSTQPVVQVRDASNATVAGATNAVTATLNGAGGTLSGTTTVIAVNGVATFTNLVVTGAGTFTLTFSSGTLTSATSSSITITALPPTQLGISTQPGGAQTGQALSPQPVIQVRDANGGVVVGSTAAVTATLVGGGGTLSGTTTVNAVNGVATFTNLVVTGPGSYSMSFTSGSLSSASSTGFTVTALPPTQLCVCTQPGGAQSGSTLSPQPAVQVRDATGAVVFSATNAVTMTLNGAGGTLSGTTTVNAVNGVATFTNLVVTGPGTYTLTASSGALTPSTSGSITITSLPATQLGVAIQPGGAQTAQALAPQPVVQVKDVNGGVVASSSVAVTATLNGAGGALSGTTTVNAVNGVATFTNLVVTGAGSYTITFSAASLTPTTSASITITPPPAASINLNVGATATANGVQGANLAIPIIADMSNAQGQVLASLSFNVTWDATKFDFVSTANGTFGTSGSYFVNPANQASGSIAVSVFDNNGFSTGTPTILTVTLRPKLTASGTPVTLVVTAAGDDIGNTIPNSKFIVRPLAVTTP